MFDKLNLGCGTKKYDGFLNMDIRSEVNPDILGDVSDLSQFASETFSYIRAEDILEHISHRRTWLVLAEWVRCLKIGGILEIQVPSIERIIADKDVILGRHSGDSTDRLSQLIFGGQDYPANFHTACFTYGFFKLAEKKLPIKISKYSEIGLYNHQVYFEKIRKN